MIQVTSEAALAIALYLASELDLDTMGCFFDLQETDLLVVGQAPQSESVKACNVNLVDPFKAMPCPKVDEI